MPRLPFARGIRAATFCCLLSPIVLMIIAAATAVCSATAAHAAPPIARITAGYGTRGQAPFAVHVHGLTTSCNAGDEATARFAWNFGDAGGAHNALVGWNAAHIYNQPGTYTITLTVTNVNREVGTVTMQVIVDPPVRSAVYISPAGNDANSGASPSSPIRTLSRAQQFMGDNRAFYLQRGGVFTGSDGLSTGNRNVLFSAYGAGADPLILSSSSTPYTRIIQVKPEARDVVVENIQFDSIFTPNSNIVRGLEMHGNNVTVRNCRFGKVSYAMNSGGAGVYGLLTQDNDCGVLGGYYIWIEGADHTHIGNTVLGSVDEHIIRIAGATRVLIARNDFTNDDKSSIWCMLGDHAYIASNTLRMGRVLTGPNFAVTYPGEQFSTVVIEGNTLIEAQAIMYDGSERITLRNNIFRAHGLEAISIWAYSAERGRGVRDVVVANNTIINDSPDYGKAMALGEGAVNVLVANNIYAAPWLNSHYGGNVFAGGSTLGGNVFSRNIWANPVVGSRWHSLGGWSFNASQWNALPETDGESHRTFGPNDLTFSGWPNFSANFGVPVAGVLVDFNDQARPAAGPWVIGALTSNAGSSGPSGDVNGDGLVNVTDLLGVITVWGWCGTCPADVNDDGAVNVADLLVVVTDWG